MHRTTASKSVVTLYFRVENISMLRQRAFSQPVFIRDLPWRIMVQPCFETDGSLDQNVSLGFFLQCDGNLQESPNWSCKAHVKLRLMPKKPGIKAFSCQFTDRFHSKGNNWGYMNFIDWPTLMLPSNGYVKNDYIDLEVDVKADAPIGLQSQVSKPEVKISNLNGPGRSKANVHFRIENISKLQQRVLSKPVYVRNLPWRIIAQPCYGQDGRKLSLGIFLHCDGQVDSPNWNCKAEVKLRMLSQKRGLKCIVSQFNDTFTASANDWGYSNFISWQCLVNPSGGYVNRNDFVDLIVDIKAEEPQGLRSQIPGEKETPKESKKLVINLPNDFLTCPICFELPRSEIFQCRNGHVVCGDCINNLTYCPQCRLRFEERIRNRALECILENLKMECSYKAKGCNMEAQMRQLTEHERTCAFQFVK